MTHFKPRVLLATYYDRDVIAGPLARLREKAEIIDVNRGRCVTAEELAEALPGIHAVIAADEKYTAAIMDVAKDLLMIVRDGTGYEAIDLDAATERGIIVTRAPVVHFATANMTIGLMIALVRRLTVCDRGIRRGLWTQRDRWLCPDLTGMTLGILGLGQVGVEVAKRARAMGMKLLAYDLADVTDRAAEVGAEVASLDQVLAASDVVAVHIRHTEKTRNMFDAALFAKMRKGAYFVNTSRGGIVDEGALVGALNSGHLAGAALDVFAQEPTPGDNPLLAMDNVVCTPHVGGDTSTTMVLAIDMNVTQIFECLAGRQCEHILNPQVWETARIHSVHRR